MSALLAVLAAAATPTCALPPGWEAVEARRTRFVVVGEIHGSAEVPALVGGIACALAARGERVLLAVELDSSNDAELRALWSLPHPRFRASLPRFRGWTGRNDGVGSRAMADLLLALHARRAAGAAVDVVAFNGARDANQQARFASLPGQGPHEAAQAENIRDAAARGRYDRVLVLVGEVHARRRPVTDHGAAFDPMARRLAPASDVTSLRVVDGGGSLWGCQLRDGYVPRKGEPVAAEAIGCTSRPAKAMADLGPGPFARLGDPPGAPGGGTYDGYLWVGRVTASPPVAATVAPQ